jgi:hypothetical protein
MTVPYQANTQNVSHSSERSLTLEEKRQVLHAALLRYLPEAQPLRERALERVVLIGLLGSSEDQPYRIGQIQRNFGSGMAEVRVEVIRQVLDRLILAGKVGHKPLNTRQAYYLKPDQYPDLAKAIGDAANLFDAPLRRMLKGTEYLVPYEAGAGICRRFICECFARFGRQIAKTVMGRLSGHDLLQVADARAAFRAAANGKGLSAPALELLEGRCLGFLKSADLEDERLKFYLTQGYYLTQLLGLEGGQFNPLAEQAFAGAIFYLDTNTILPHLLPSDDKRNSFEELSRVAKRIGIELRVTRATINEARLAAYRRLPVINKIMERVPGQLLHRTNDQFLNAYLDAREEQPGLSFERFLEPFDRISAILQEESGVFIDDREEADVIGQQDFSRAAEVIKAKSESCWGRGKGEKVLGHDVCHYALVCEARKSHAKTWFLTNDRSLVQAAIQLADDQQPFCFSFAGLLQSISPFLTAIEEHSFADMFSDLITEQVLPMESVYDMQELLVLAEIHEDVQSTPPEQLVEACEYVKASTFHGRQITPADAPLLLLGLRKFLASSADEKSRALAVEAERIRKEREQALETASAERRRREAAEHEAEHFERELEREKSERLRALASREDTRKKSGELQSELTELRTELAALTESEKCSQQRILDLQARSEQANHRYARAWMAGGMILACVLWLVGDAFTSGLQNKWPALLSQQKHLQALVNFLGFALFTLPAVRLARISTWASEAKFWFVATVFTAALGASNLVPDATGSVWSAYLQIGSTLAGIGITLRSGQKTGS